MLLNNHWVNNEIMEEIKKFWKQMKMIQNRPKPLGHSKGSPEREVHSHIGLPKRDRNVSNKPPNPSSTRTGETTPKPKVSRRKEITKIRVELNDID